jgi:Na+-transporting NADH:ubiquinone oxidoreductase subunit NqrE
MTSIKITTTNLNCNSYSACMLHLSVPPPKTKHTSVNFSAHKIFLKKYALTTTLKNVVTFTSSITTYISMMHLNIIVQILLQDFPMKMIHTVKYEGPLMTVNTNIMQCWKITPHCFLWMASENFAVAVLRTEAGATSCYNLKEGWRQMMWVPW